MKIILNIILLSVIASGIMGLQGCGDDDKPKTELEKLPAATQEGKGTLGCLVNGKAWVTKTTVDSWAFYQDGVLLITAQLNDGYRDQGMSIYIYDNELSLGEYTLSDNIDQFSFFANFGDDKEDCSYQTTLVYDGKLTLNHLDQVNFIISGTFDFEAYSDDCNKIVNVKSGRFDLRYAP